jgi:hypothetical protein
VLAIVHLCGKCLFQNQECFHLPRAQLRKLDTMQAPPDEKLLYLRLALSRNVRRRASLKCHVLTRPHQERTAIFRRRQPSAPALLFQAVFPADVALPTGLVGKLKMEGD